MTHSVRFLITLGILLMCVQKVDAQRSNYSLPVPSLYDLNPFMEDDLDLSDDDFIIEFIAHPVAVSLSSILTLDGRKVLSLPILMEDKDLPVASYSKLIHPNRWAEMGYTSGTGRRSIWFMENDNEMLYSILLDIESLTNNQGIGIGYLSVIRKSDTIYDWLLRGYNLELLYAVRGEKIIIDESVGESTFYSLRDQSELRKEYNFLWKSLPAKDFVMFTR